MTGPMLMELLEVEELEMMSVVLATAALDMATVEKALSTGTCSPMSISYCVSVVPNNLVL
jgi:response regulator of citrate/malate metabolism